MNQQRLSMPLGEAMFSQRSVRKFKPDPISVDDLHLIMEAAVRAPNGGNSQPGPVPHHHRPSEDPGVRQALPRGVVGQAPGREARLDEA